MQFSNFQWTTFCPRHMFIEEDLDDLFKICATMHEFKAILMEIFILRDFDTSYLLFLEFQSFLGNILDEGGVIHL